MTTVVRIDPILGEIRRCPGCREWWPQDAEFFNAHPYFAGDQITARGRRYTRGTSGVTWRCRACDATSQRESDRRRSLRQAKSVRMMGHCQTDGCPVRVPFGRDHCHGCAGRVAGPLTAERTRDLLHPRRVAA